MSFQTALLKGHQDDTRLGAGRADLVGLNAYSIPHFFPLRLQELQDFPYLNCSAEILRIVPLAGNIMLRYPISILPRFITGTM